MTLGFSTERAVFVDTSAAYAYLDPHDQYHARSQRGFHDLGARGTVLVMSDLMVSETYRLAFQRLGVDVARAWLDIVTGFNLVFQNQQRHDRTAELLTSPAGSRLSYPDAAAIITMRDVGIRNVFTFDNDFVIAGFERVPA